jgi:hypothetical protein
MCGGDRCLRGDPKPIEAGQDYRRAWEASR